jgi:hypothetical protein
MNVRDDLDLEGELYFMGIEDQTHELPKKYSYPATEELRT